VWRRPSLCWWRRWAVYLNRSVCLGGLSCAGGSGGEFGNAGIGGLGIGIDGVVGDPGTGGSFRAFFGEIASLPEASNDGCLFSIVAGVPVE